MPNPEMNVHIRPIHLSWSPSLTAAVLSGAFVGHRCSPRLQMITTCERMSEDKLKEVDRLFAQMTTEDGLAPETLTYSHLIYGCVGCESVVV